MISIVRAHRCAHSYDDGDVLRCYGPRLGQPPWHPGIRPNVSVYLPQTHESLPVVAQSPYIAMHEFAVILSSLELYRKA
jgi:hypothetical protein